jgi:hypothetical protein
MAELNKLFSVAMFLWKADLCCANHSDAAVVHIVFIALYLVISIALCMLPYFIPHYVGDIP